MTKEETIKQWWPHIQQTVLEAVALWYSGGEPRRSMHPDDLQDQVPKVAKRACCAVYNAVMDRLLDMSARGMDSWWVQKTGEGDKRLALPFTLSGLMERVEAPDIGLPKGFKL